MYIVTFRIYYPIPYYIRRSTRITSFSYLYQLDFLSTLRTFPFRPEETLYMEPLEEVRALDLYNLPITLPDMRLKRRESFNVS